MNTAGKRQARSSWWSSSVSGKSWLGSKAKQLVDKVGTKSGAVSSYGIKQTANKEP